jgi:hypothetical protein
MRDRTQRISFSFPQKHQLVPVLDFPSAHSLTWQAVPILVRDRKFYKFIIINIMMRA